MVETHKGYQNLRHVVPGNKLANEMAWEQIFKWEAMHGGGMECGGIKLISFARFKSNRTPSAAWAVFLGWVPQIANLHLSLVIGVITISSYGLSSPLYCRSTNPFALLDTNRLMNARTGS